MKKWVVVFSVWIILSGFEPSFMEEWDYSCESGTSGEVFTTEDNHIVVCGTYGVPEEVVALTKKGEVEWTHDVKGVVQPVFEEEAERLWMVSEAREDGFDYILDVGTGERSAPLTFDFPDDIAISERTFMKAANGHLHVFGGAEWHAVEQNGEKAFTFTGNDQLIPELSWNDGSYFVADDVSFSDDPYVYKVDENGEPIWRKSAALEELPLFSEDFVWFTEPYKGIFHALKQENGRTVSEQEGDFYHRLLMTDPLLMEEYLFSKSNLYQLSSRGDVEWKTELEPYRLEEYITENEMTGDQWLLQGRNASSSDSYRLFSQNVYFFNEQNKEIASLTKLYEDGSFAWSNRELPTIHHTAIVEGSIIAAGEGYVAVLNQGGKITDRYEVDEEVTQLVEEDDGVLTVTSEGVARLTIPENGAAKIDDFLPTSATQEKESASVTGSKVWHVEFNTEISEDGASKNIAVVNESGAVVEVYKKLSEDGEKIRIDPPAGGYEEGVYAITVHDRISSPYGKLLKEETYQKFKVR
ncbi:hypothetical protein [Salimicrobium flavidum]|uniref:PQQ-like domain-containing protein n=1 Tax=Salimicrobium flavidum TaxID=570947 RepID=A0A1N7JHA7_9BACI|nr:hypothetical protein [Salimicrobium flavidum]SIS48699.1 hypothetical protein SAMN05421687_10619 [Salimicrobium flavidum]